MHFCIHHLLQLKNLKPGNCIAFGSAFKVPTSLYVDLPNPKPLSNNVDLEDVWYHSAPLSVANQPQSFQQPQTQPQIQQPIQQPQPGVMPQGLPQTMAFPPPINNMNQQPSPTN